MRIALFQSPGVPASVEGNLERLAAAAAEAAARGARLLLCPEMFLCGYAIDSEEIRRLAEDAGGPSAGRVADIAKASNLAILYGYPEREGEAVYNAAQLIDCTGRSLANHRKCHLYGPLDHRIYAPGSTLTRAELEGVPVALLICYDVEFPECVRAHALAGAALVLVPTALMHPYDFVARAMIPTRAFENQLFVAYANRCGAEGAVRYTGLSVVAGPDGAVVAMAGESEELLVADLDPDAIARARRDFNYVADRRPGLYAEAAIERESAISDE